MSIYVRIENGEVKDCWDSPPDDRPGWKNAIEVKPAITPHRQRYIGHIFDITKDPVEIVYNVVDISVDDRKAAMKENALFKFQAVLMEQARNPSAYDPAALQVAKDAVAPEQAAIDACTTHDQLDDLI